MSEAAGNSQDGNDLPEPLEESLTVDLIATFGLRACSVDEGVGDVLSESAFEDFDFVPVRDGQYIVGLLERAKAPPDRRVGEVMLPLRESNIISSKASILSFIESADEHPCRLVLRNRVIDGIVTWADLNKLPVRPAIFLLVTHLELLMAQWIRSQRSADDAVSLLGDGRREKVEQRWAQLQREELAIDRVAATEIADKKTMMMKLDFPIARIPVASKEKARGELEKVEWLRNGVAHAGDYAGSRGNTAKTIEAVRITKKWIEAIKNNLFAP